MPTRSRLVSALLALVVSGVLAEAGELQGRGHTWTFEANAGAAVLDGGFSADFFGFTVPSNLKVPPTSADKLESVVPTVGFRAGYNFTRFFGLELSAASGEASVGDGTSFILELDGSLPASLRAKPLAEQTAVAPIIADRISSIDYDYLGGTLTAVFSFNTRPTSRWNFYFAVGGGVYSLDTDTGAFNDCLTGSNVRVITDPGNPDVRIFNDKTQAESEPTAAFDREPDNPLQIARFDEGCQRSFPLAEQIQLTPSKFVFGQPVFRDARAIREDTSPDVLTRNTTPFLTEEGGGCIDLLNCGDQTPIYLVQPGIVQNNSLGRIDPLRSVTNPFYTVGTGLRFWAKPRQSLRLDFRRHFDENNNKNINQFTLGYGFTLGQGRDIRSSQGAPPPPAADAVEDATADPVDPPGDDNLPPPAADDLPPPADDDPPLT